MAEPTTRQLDSSRLRLTERILRQIKEGRSMSEQQYRVIADRDKGDDLSWHDVEPEDRYTSIKSDGPYPDPLMRIERPVPTTDEPQAGRYDNLRADLATMARQERTPDHWAIGRNQRTARAALLAIDELIAQHPPTREQIAPLPEDARMDAYYYGFERTGVGFIDAILSAVAIAGKGAHHTESWGSEPWEGTPNYFHGHPGLPDGENAVDLIQKAAQQAADAVLALLQKEADR